MICQTCHYFGEGLCIICKVCYHQIQAFVPIWRSNFISPLAVSQEFSLLVFLMVLALKLHLSSKCPQAAGTFMFCKAWRQLQVYELPCEFGGRL